MSYQADYPIVYTIAAVKNETKDPHKRPPMRKIIIVACIGSTRVSLAYIVAYNLNHLWLINYDS